MVTGPREASWVLGVQLVPWQGEHSEFSGHKDQVKKPRHSIEENLIALTPEGG